MADMIEADNAFFTGIPAWHGKGEVYRDAPPIHVAAKRACPYELFQLDIAAKMTGPDGTPLYHNANGYSAIVRSDGKVLGVHSDRYGLTQPYEMFNRFAPLVDSGLVQLEAGGLLNEGKKLWILGKIKGGEADIVPGDPVKAYLLFQTSFDGSCTAGAGFTGVRVVCANTLAMAQGDVSYRTKHTKNVNQRLDAYRDDIARTLHAFRENVESMRTLASKQVTRKEQETYIRHVLAGPENAEELSTKMENKISEVIELLDTQKGLELVPRIRGTAWQAYNAVTDYVTHRAGRTQDSRLDSQWFGVNAKVNQRALEMAFTM